METIKQIYRDPSIGLSGINNICKKAKAIDKSITLKQVKEVLNEKYSAQLHKPINKIKNYYSITSSHENDIMQIDLMDMKDIATNKNYKWLFVVVDVFTRKAYVYPMKNKLTKSIIESFNKLLKKVKPNKITCDLGSEFISSSFTKLCNDNNIIIDYLI